MLGERVCDCRWRLSNGYRDNQLCVFFFFFQYLLSPSFQSMKRICVYEVLSPILQISSGSEVVCATTENEVIIVIRQVLTIP